MILIKNFLALIASVLILPNASTSKQEGTNDLPSFQIDLSSNWTLMNSNLGIIVENLTLPISVTTALRQAKIENIPDPLYRYNDIALRYIVQDDNWIFVNKFKIDNFLQINTTSSIDLVFECIDTIASVYINDKFILNGNNQFLKYEVKSLNSKLNSDTNLLTLKFSSPIKQATALAYTYPYYVPSNCPPDVQHGECHVNFIRKEACSFSWDWGPAFAPIYLGNVSFNIIQTFAFKYHFSVYPQSANDLTNWIIDIDIDITQFTQSLNSFILISIDQLDFFVNKTIQLNPSQTSINFKLELSANDYNISLWWPLGYGQQTLYTLNIELNIKSQSEQKSKLFGFRSVQLVQDKIANNIEGLTFYFKINNLNTYLKGSNWIPADSFQELITADYLNWLLKSARDANINILRVWGGGLYERDSFYDLADKYGIMIWQDFMFACNFYPTNDEFLTNVQNEVLYQINRLRHHPSIVVWSGNNENEAAYAQNWYNTSYDKDLYANDYRKLYIDTIMKIVVAFDPELSRPFISSSPTNGKESIEENWLAENPGDLRYGDLHHYSYNDNWWDVNTFPVARLMSEFGVQSLPSLSTLSKAYLFPDDADIFSDLNQYRQHHGDGNKQLVDEIQKNLRLPNITDKVENFRAYIYLSQVYQAMSLRTGSELYRRKRNELDEKTGLGMCSGTMYWQFNDIWQAPTWASIEYGGKWKMAHYYIKNSYSPLILSPTMNATHLSVYAVSDLQVYYGGSFDLKIFSYANFSPLYQQTIKFSIEPLNSKPVAILSLDQIQKFSNCSTTSNISCILTLESSDKQIQEGSSNFLFFKNRLADVTNLKKPNLAFNISQKSNKETVFTISLTTDSISLFVWLDIETSEFVGKFSDNGFHMTSSNKIVTFATDDSNVSVDDIKKFLSVTSLMNIY